MISCSSFILAEDAEKLKVYESVNGVYEEYILLQDVERREMTLAKGERVRIMIVTDDEWIKVYAYKAAGDPLKSVRFLILHMFNDDFTDNMFDRQKFDQELVKIVSKAGASDEKKASADKNKTLTKDKKKGKSK